MAWQELPGAESAKIAPLTSAVIDQIAAGEVIERPASVIRELLDNALDAGATQVEIAVEGGSRLLRVSDDGRGMSPPQARLALQRHATSKLRQVDDLLSVRTFGFRGEGLTSIASVSQLLLRTRPAASEQAVELDVRAGEVISERPVGARVGTTVEVRDLFFNTPARRKFQKSPATETAHVVDVVERLASAVCSVGFTLLVEGRPQLELPAATERRERVRTLLRLSGGELLTLRRDEGDLRVEAYLARPPRSLTTARSLNFLVNARPVRDRALLTAVLRGLSGQLEPGRYPVGVVYVDLDPAALDVNVHPQKSEVRFAEPQRIFRAVRQAVAEGSSGAAKASDRGTAFDERLPAATRTYRLGGTSGSDAAERGAPSYLEQRERIAEATRRFFSAASQPEEDFGLGAALAAAETPTPTKPAVQLVGRTSQGLAICEQAGALWVLDERASMRWVVSRVLQQRLEAGESLESRELPRALPLSKERSVAVESVAGALARLGVMVEPFGAGAWLLRAVSALPADFRAEASEAMEGDGLAETRGEQDGSWLGLLDALAQALAPGTTPETLRRCAALVGERLSPAPQLEQILAHWESLAAMAQVLQPSGSRAPLLCLSREALGCWRRSSS